MKKKITLNLILAVVLTLSTTVSNAQAVEKGNMIADVYYGWGSLNKAFLKSITDNNTAKLTSFGPIGARFEYMTSDKIGIGFDFNYTDNTVSWDDDIYTYKYNVTRIRFMPRINIHFGGSENFDAYFGAAAGYRSVNRTYSSTDPLYQGSTTAGINPIAIRIALGARYFITDNIGLGLEMGLGGGYLLHSGLAFKF